MRLTSLLLLLTLNGSAFAQGTFFRAADGKWKPLKATTAGTITKFSLTPEEIGSGATLIVVNKPAWMVLEDEAAPALVKALVDGQEKTVEQLDLGQVMTAPAEFAFAVKDDKNPLDPQVLVLLNGQALPAAQVTVSKLDKDGKSLRVAVKPGELPAARYTLLATVADMSPARNAFSLQLKFSTAPMLSNGSFEQAASDGSPTDWVVGAWSSDAATKYEAGVREGGVAGKYAFRFNGQAGSLNLVCTQDVPDLKAGVTYILSGQYKSENGGALSAISYLGGKDVDYLSQALPAARDWTPFAWEFQLKEHDKATMVVRTGAKGETWFDDVALKAK